MGKVKNDETEECTIEGAYEIAQGSTSYTISVE